MIKDEVLKTIKKYSLINKGDKIEFNLYNHLPSRDASYFLSEFNVSKPKKGCIITTLMLHMIMI